MKIIIAIILIIIITSTIVLTGAVSNSIRVKTQRENKIATDWHRLNYQQAKNLAPVRTRVKIAFIQFGYYASVIAISSLLGVGAWYVISFLAIDLSYRRQVKIVTFDKQLFMVHSGPAGVMVFNPQTDSVVLLSEPQSANLQLAEYSTRARMARSMGNVYDQR